MDDEGDGVGTLLAVSLIAEAKAYSEWNGSQRKALPEDVFNRVFDKCDTYMGTSKHDPRVKSVNLEKTPWEFTTQHLVAYWAKVPALNPAAVRKAGGRYDTTREILLADTEEQLDHLIRTFKLVSPERGVMGSNHQRILGKSHELTGKGKTGESDCFYLYGPTLDAARKKFFPVLLAMEVPMLPEWDNHFWKLFQSNGWVKELLGRKMAGFKIELKRDAVCALISQEIKARHDFLKPTAVPAELWV